jgi:hypothetical protein
MSVISDPILSGFASIFQFVTFISNRIRPFSGPYEFFGFHGAVVFIQFNPFVLIDCAFVNNALNYDVHLSLTAVVGTEKAVNLTRCYFSGNVSTGAGMNVTQCVSNTVTQFPVSGNVFPYCLDRITLAFPNTLTHKQSAVFPNTERHKQSAGFPQTKSFEQSGVISVTKSFEQSAGFPNTESHKQLGVILVTKSFEQSEECRESHFGGSDGVLISSVGISMDDKGVESESESGTEMTEKSVNSMLPVILGSAIGGFILIIVIGSGILFSLRKRRLSSESYSTISGPVETSFTPSFLMTQFSGHVWENPQTDLDPGTMSIFEDIGESELNNL